LQRTAFIDLKTKDVSRFYSLRVIEDNCYAERNLFTTRF